MLLNRLPTELLVNIFSKTEKSTTRKCRLLNSDLNRITKRYGLHKEDVETLWISHESKTAYSISINKKTVQKSFENYDDLLIALSNNVKNIHNLNKLELTRVEINNKLLDLLSSEHCFCSIKALIIDNCNLNVNENDKWICYLEKLNLGKLIVSIDGEKAAIAIPEMMLNRVKNFYRYFCFHDNSSIEMLWFDDNLLNKWYSAEKQLYMRRCRTSLTVNGILNCLEKNYKDFPPRYGLDLGKIKYSAQEIIQDTLNRANVEWSSFAANNRIHYIVTAFREKKIYVTFACSTVQPEL